MVQENEDVEALTPLEAAGAQRDTLKRLTGSPEWGMVLAFIKDQSEKRVLEIMTTREHDEKGKADVHFTKGEYNGLQLVRVYIETLVENAEDLVELYREQAKLENSANAT